MIHPTALVDPKAELADDVEVGAFTIIDGKVRIDAGSRIGPHVVITGRTTIGKNNHIFQFASIGEEPQDKKYGGEDTELIIGDNNTIREYAPSAAAPCKAPAKPSSAVTTGSWPACTSRTIASWATTSSWPIMPRWQVMSLWATGPYCPATR